MTECGPLKCALVQVIPKKACDHSPPFAGGVAQQLQERHIGQPHALTRYICSTPLSVEQIYTYYAVNRSR